MVIFLRRLRDIYHTFGWRDLLRRLIYEGDKRSGQLHKRTAASSWDKVAIYEGEVGKFFFSAGAGAHQRYVNLMEGLHISKDNIIQRANEFLGGELFYFSSTSYRLGFPPLWHYHPKACRNFPKDRHWTQIPDLSPDLGDIKMIWEMSRFSFTFILVRAYYVTGDDKYPEAFWQAVESWLDENPPNQGANWKCGQEIALRSFAWVFGYFALLGARATTEQRREMILTALSLQAERIEHNIRYGLSQRNNHGISEAAGLWTAGLILSEHPRAKIWQNKGGRLLEELAREQIYPDGAYAQHSFNYQRLMLSLYLWSIRLGDVNQQPLSDKLRGSVFHSAKLLHGVQDVFTGWLPNYGSNDGALLFPLSHNDYEDYRSIIQAIHYLGSGEKVYPAGTHDEMLWWFWGNEVVQANTVESPREDLFANEGGYYSLRGKESFAFTRAASYRHRPHQADNLHVDIWHRGENIAFDPGTYSYNSPEPWNNGLVHTRVHNTITVDNQNQMERGSRFLWFNWLKSDVVKYTDADITWLAMTHSAYNQLSPPVQHERTLIRVFDSYICVDRLLSTGKHTYQLNWNLWKKPQEFDGENGLLKYVKPWNYHIQILSNKDFSSFDIIDAQENDVRAWRSTKYNSKEAAQSLVVMLQESDCVIVSVFNHQKAMMEEDRCFIDLNERELVIELSLKEHGVISDLVWQEYNSDVRNPNSGKGLKVRR